MSSLIKNNQILRLFLCGDVMFGRGLDQILPHPGSPEIHEQYLRSATDYVKLAERLHGPIPRGVSFSYPWGKALKVLDDFQPQVRVVNLETSITTSQDRQPKGINYRMHPANAPVLSEALIDICTIANNHILDWGPEGLFQTLTTLHSLGIQTAGAGRDSEEAMAPAVVEISATPPRRLLVFALATDSSGVPPEWKAQGNRAGVRQLADLSPQRILEIKRQVQHWKVPGDRVLVSIHWGANWGYHVPESHRFFARSLLTEAEVDLVHGHSSHHFLGLEVYEGKLIVYGCGDFINDYEGIRGQEEYRPDLTLMYFPDLEVSSGKLLSLRVMPLRRRRFCLEPASPEERKWIRSLLEREAIPQGLRFEPQKDGSLRMIFQEHSISGTF